MKIERGLIVALGALTAAACAGGTGGGGSAPSRGASASLPQVACATNAATATTFATSAQGALNRTLVVQGDARAPYYQQAMDQARQGITAEPNNPLHYFLAGQAAVGMNDLAAADSLFDRTLELCPEFGTLVTPERQQAWATAFQTGLDAYQGGDTARAIATWEAAGQFYDERPDIFYNLAVVYGQRNDYPRAVANYRKALEAANRAPGDSAVAETRANALNGLLSSGAQLFQQERFSDAAEIFALLNQVDPNNRDAWYNHALALYKQERWQQLIPVATRLVQVDPLNYNGQIILFNAYKGISEAAKARNDQATERQNR
ncbi:MAG TPA: tetratricopeptide repeat protein, partial [Longimicrobium sp.]|nr:tetratricopeptide repeat protein [Longimicrobium sp.]